MLWLDPMIGSSAILDVHPMSRFLNRRQLSCVSLPFHSVAALLSALALSGCLSGGGGGGDGGGAAATGTPSGGASTSPAPAQSGGSTTTTPSTPTQPTSPGTSTPQSGAVFERQPVIASCDAGTLTLSEKQSVLAALNAVRALHRLPPVTYDSSTDIYEQKSALIGVANRALTHTPPTSFYCYTPEGAQGSNQSNLFLAGGYTPASTESITRFLVDEDVISLGHRRWVLHPFLSQTSFGRVDGVPLTGGTTRYSAMSLKVIGYPDANLTASDLSYVAYPEGVYPAQYFRHGWFMSFSVLANKTNTWANGVSAVDFANATVQVTGPGGAALQIAERSHNYAGYGLPNFLQWKAFGTQSNVDYAVRIAGVRVNGQARDYQYTFRIQ
jgi:uncharacterized protein YkwD